MSNKLYKKIEGRLNRKITNLVDELHWKTINFLISNYKTILIGDMSVKGIVCNKTSKLSKMTKKVALRMKFYQFRQRLEHKSFLNKIHYSVINEMYTSKMCSSCGYCDDKLGGNKVYHCKGCGMIMDRDVNGARGILIKSTYKSNKKC